jgi:hypothetical protein
MPEQPEKEKITIPEAIGFWQKNKSWLVPALMAIMGVIGGANVDKIPMPKMDTPEEVKTTLEDHEVRISKLEGNSSPSDSSKKNEGGSQSDDVIKVE